VALYYSSGPPIQGSNSYANAGTTMMKQDPNSVASNVCKVFIIRLRVNVVILVSRVLKIIIMYSNDEKGDETDMLTKVRVVVFFIRSHHCQSVEMI
jgi:hypothetical protein